MYFISLLRFNISVLPLSRVNSTWSIRGILRPRCFQSVVPCRKILGMRRGTTRISRDKGGSIKTETTSSAGWNVSSGTIGSIPFGTRTLSIIENINLEH